jgi:hypothetical protein
MTTDKKTPLKIVKFEAENVKKLRAVSITPTGALVEIRGRNGQGKTSILDSIWWAIGGLGNVQAEPIRKGEDKARIRLDLGEVIVTRNFSKRDDGSTASTITVESADGARWPQPQKMLDSLVGTLTFDPLEFARMKPKQQFDVMKGFVPGYDFEAMALLSANDFSKRTDFNRHAKEQATLAATISIPDTTPTEKIDEAALVREIGKVGEFNAQIDLRVDRRKQVAKDIDQLKLDAEESRAEIEELQRQIKARIDHLTKEAEDYDAARAELEKKLAAAPPLDIKKDAAEVTKRLEDAKRVNAQVDAAAKRQAHLDAAKAFEAKAAELTQAIADREAAKQKAISEAKLPIEGLTFGDGQILLDGNPFDQASDAQKLRASVAIGMANNPRLHVMRVRDGSLLDEDALKILGEMAAAADFQVWLEAVDSTGKVGIVIEDGAVKSTPESRGDQPDLLDTTK